VNIKFYNYTLLKKRKGKELFSSSCSFTTQLRERSREKERIMAAGGAHKGNGNGNRGRPYGLMLLLAFGAALLGVMVLHKFRERRIFNLLVKEKDRELMSLQLILQVPPSPPTSLSLSLSLSHACMLLLRCLSVRMTTKKVYARFHGFLHHLKSVEEGCIAF
jgi:hypothetical protein